jgi:general secretion pathway protein L
MPQRILGLDVGSWSVKGVFIEDSFRGFRVERVSEIRVSEGPPETRADRLKAAIAALLAESELKVDAYEAALPGELATTRFITMPYADPKKIAATIGGEIADIVPFDLDEAVFDHSIERKLEDGSTISLSAIAPKPRVTDFLTLLQEAGADPKHLGVDAIELYNLYSHFLRTDLSKAETPGSPSPESSTFVAPAPGGPPNGRLIVDLGHERTLLCACTDDGLAFVRVIREGGRGVTQAIADGLHISFAQAEDMKHQDGFVASSRHPPSNDGQERMSELVAKGLAPLFRELRRSLQTIRAERRVTVTRIDLVGGGSRLRNLANRMAEELNVPSAQALAVEQIVERQVDAARRPAYASALAIALRGAGDERVASIDLRKGDYQFAGQLLHFRERIGSIALGAGVIVLLLAINVFASYHQVIKRERAIDMQFCEVTKQVIGREICEPKEAISVMRQPASELGNVRLPQRSALNIAAELSQRIPNEIKDAVLIDEMDITPERARISGETNTFDAVDSMVGEYSKDPCYTDLKKGKLRRTPSGDKVEFQLSMNMECS